MPAGKQSLLLLFQKHSIWKRDLRPGAFGETWDPGTILKLGFETWEYKGGAQDPGPLL